MSEPIAPGFLLRWSRRKLAARRAEAEIGAEPSAAEQPDDVQEGEPEPGQPIEEAAELELPDIETLDATSDFKPFMRPGVPTELRREALRKLWRANPIINSLDGLDDHYCTADFTDAATVVPDLQTVYRVGRGMVEALEQMADSEPAKSVASVTQAPAGLTDSEAACPAPPGSLESIQEWQDTSIGQTASTQRGDDGDRG